MLRHQGPLLTVELKPLAHLQVISANSSTPVIDLYGTSPIEIHSSELGIAGDDGKLLNVKSWLCYVLCVPFHRFCSFHSAYPIVFMLMNWFVFALQLFLAPSDYPPKRYVHMLSRLESGLSENIWNIWMIAITLQPSHHHQGNHMTMSLFAWFVSSQKLLHRGIHKSSLTTSFAESFMLGDCVRLTFENPSVFESYTCEGFIAKYFDCWWLTIDAIYVLRGAYGYVFSGIHKVHGLHVAIKRFDNVKGRKYIPRETYAFHALEVCEPQ